METILIQNFKAIKNAAKREIKVANLTILTGEQATGKSTVAKLVYFFKNIPEQILDILLHNTLIEYDEFSETITSKLWIHYRRLFGSPFYSDYFEVTYCYNNNISATLKRIENSPNIAIQWSSEINILRDKLFPIYLELSKIENKYDDISRREWNRLVNIIADLVKSHFGIIQHQMYVPASRNFTVVLEDYLFEIFSKIEDPIYSLSDIPENNYILIKFVNYIRLMKNRFKNKNFNLFLEKENENNDYFDELLNKISLILVGTYFNSQDGELLYFDDKRNDFVFLNNASSGQQEIIRIIQDVFLEILEDRPVFRVYEEPESHLSPVGQLGIIQLIAMLSNRNPDNQIIIPTHTPYLLREVSNMMKASKIVKDNPELKDEVGKILKPFYWLGMQNVSAYQLTREGEIEDAVDEEYQMIDGELFDRVTNDISDQLDQLLSLQYE